MGSLENPLFCNSFKSLISFNLGHLGRQAIQTAEQGGSRVVSFQNNQNTSQAILPPDYNNVCGAL